MLWAIIIQDEIGAGSAPGLAEHPARHPHPTLANGMGQAQHAALHRSGDGGLLENRLIRERNEVLPVIYQKPESQPCNTRDFTERYVYARHWQTPLDVSSQSTQSAAILWFAGCDSSPEPLSVLAKTLPFRQQWRRGRASVSLHGY